MKKLNNLFKQLKRNELFKKLVSFVSQKELIFPIVAIILVGIVIVAGIFSTVSRVGKNNEDHSTSSVFYSAQQDDRHPLTGEILKESMEDFPQVFGVMVENSADAWPLSGLDSAFLVIEAPVEGNIPRFIAFFSEESSAKKIGPVRSARPYYVDWNDELGAMYAHVGGSPEALELIRNEYETIDLNQFWNSQYFYRQTTGGRYAPHNVYTNIEMLTDAMNGLELEEPAYGVWLFKDGEVSGREVSLELTYGSSNYNVGWEYDVLQNSYLRIQKGGTDSPVNADNVVVAEMDVRVIDGVGRKSIDTLKGGDAMIFQNGELILGTWEKEDRIERMRFYDLEGEEILFNAGTTWIEVVDNLRTVKITDASE